MRGAYAAVLAIWIVGVRFIPTCVGLTCADQLEQGLRVGSSPHAWGLRSQSPRRKSGCRFIPTCVGLTNHFGLRLFQSPVHPHMRGAYCHSRCAHFLVSGSSPHAWGLQDGSFMVKTALRFIPTCVGLTTASRVFSLICSVHPHMRGAYSVSTSGRFVRMRFIPTCVGLTPSRTSPASW